MTISLPTPLHWQLSTMLIDFMHYAAKALNVPFLTSLALALACKPPGASRSVLKQSTYTTFLCTWASKRPPKTGRARHTSGSSRTCAVLYVYVYRESRRRAHLGNVGWGARRRAWSGWSRHAVAAERPPWRQLDRAYVRRARSPARRAKRCACAGSWAAWCE